MRFEEEFNVRADEPLAQQITNKRTVFRLDTQHGVNKLLQITAVVFGDGRDSAAQHVERERRQVTPVESVLERYKLIQHAAHGPHVALLVIWLMAVHFGRHKVWRANQCVCHVTIN